MDGIPDDISDHDLVSHLFDKFWSVAVSYITKFPPFNCFPEPLGPEVLEALERLDRLYTAFRRARSRANRIAWNKAFVEFRKLNFDMKRKSWTQVVNTINRNTPQPSVGENLAYPGTSRATYPPSFRRRHYSIIICGNS